VGNYRLWENGEDMGTVGSERIANMWLEQHFKLSPDEPAHIEPVDDDAPVFLPKREHTL
jgi:hypothetical protein